MTKKQSTHASINLTMQYKKIYKQIVDKKECLKNLSNAAKILVKLSQSKDTLKESSQGLETCSIYLRLYSNPNPECVAAALLSGCSLMSIKKNRSILGDSYNTILQLSRELRTLEKVFLTNPTKIEEKKRIIDQIFSENIHLGELSIAKFGEIAQRILGLKSLQQKSVCILAKQFFIPMLHIVGLNDLKTDLEDCCMESTNPADYIRIVKGNFKRLNPIKNSFMKTFCIELKEHLKLLRVPIHLSYRTKGIFSIWKKLKTQNLIHEDLHDYMGVRVIIDAKEDKEVELCRLAHAILNATYNVDATKTRDWLSEPKESGYRAIHVTILNNPGMLIEVQLRGKFMNHIAENGSAAHWLYKTDGHKPEDISDIFLQEMKKNIKKDDEL
jgi:(p)ppGpp synthase/HD superfamily hydrolase